VDSACQWEKGRGREAGCARYWAERGKTGPEREEGRRGEVGLLDCLGRMGGGKGFWEFSFFFCFSKPFLLLKPF
jgi:hypothetical protein